MLRINEIKLPLDYEDEKRDLTSAVCKMLKISESGIRSVEIFKKSIDSRHKNDIKFVFSVNVCLENENDEENIVSRLGDARIQTAEEYSYEMPECRRVSSLRPVVVGFGPAGMFASLILAKAGLKPLVIERGQTVDKRTASVENFWKERKLNLNSNVQFGEGGAGTFSDGKLTTGIKDRRIREVFKSFVRFGAPEEIMYSALPHIGTDRLKEVVKNLRNEVISLGGEICFDTVLDDIIVYNGSVQGVTVWNAVTGKRTDIETDTVILAIGHSARDTVEMLYAKGIPMMQKPFSVGVRIEHRQEMINRSQYGKFCSHPRLRAASYKLACHPKGGRGAYTFCMCPGGTVVCAPSEENTVVTNGMSEYLRDKENANSAVLVGIEPEDFPSEHVLAGMYYQREIEKNAFILGGGDYTAPAQLTGDFLNGKPSVSGGSIVPSCPTGVKYTDLRTLLPEKTVNVMSEALIKMDRMLEGFAKPDSVLTAPETRSSSPVRILRDEFYQTKIRGLYPCGEGAGYAGGIVSASVDGIKTAEAVLGDER
ncbi:MAG: hypothetical protein E7514_07550 [Ruminococcaceae bacterium]|nr:hypothetical protein [Oscillospiraceae bacterium]